MGLVALCSVVTIIIIAIQISALGVIVVVVCVVVSHARQIWQKARSSRAGTELTSTRDVRAPSLDRAPNRQSHAPTNILEICTRETKRFESDLAVEYG